jgi:hypothetical protein
MVTEKRYAVDGQLSQIHAPGENADGIKTTTETIEVPIKSAKGQQLSDTINSIKTALNDTYSSGPTTANASPLDSEEGGADALGSTLTAPSKVAQFEQAPAARAQVA